MIVVLIASLVECFLILPHHMSHALASSAKEHWYDWPSRTVTKGFNWFRQTVFRPFMAGVIWARYPVLALALLLLASQAALFIKVTSHGGSSTRRNVARSLATSRCCRGPRVKTRLR